MNTLKLIYLPTLCLRGASKVKIKEIPDGEDIPRPTSIIVVGTLYAINQNHDDGLRF